MIKFAMGNLKKIVASVVALVSMVGCIGAISLNANAATIYQKGDINGDELVNNTDTQWARQFLYGMASANDSATAERLDVNQNGIIDENDVTTIRNIILHIEDNKSYTLNSIVSLPKQEDRVYYQYGAYNGNFKGSYTLTTDNAPNITSVSSRGLIDGTDDRVIEGGLNGVVRIQMNNSNRGFTGFIVDDHTILTCAHGLYDATTDKSIEMWNYQIQFYDEDGSPINGMYATPMECHIPKKYIDGIKAHQKDNNNYEFEKYDYAIITVKDTLTPYINFYLGVPRDNLVASLSSAYLTGINNGTYNNLSHMKTTSTGCLVDLNSYNVYHDMDSSGGQSGSPIYFKNNNGTNTVIGIHTYDFNDHNSHSLYNHGTRITTDILQFVYNNDNLS